VTVIARRIASVPRRTSVETWARIVELVSEPDSDARAELEGVTSVAAMLIADEYAMTEPITIAGSGPLVRVYTVHGDDAIDADLSDEDELSFDPTDGESWLLLLPASGSDVAAAEALLVSAPHVEVRDIEQAERATAERKGATGELVLSLEELMRP